MLNASETKQRILKSTHKPEIIPSHSEIDQGDLPLNSVSF